MTGSKVEPDFLTLPSVFKKKVLPLVRRIMILLDRGFYPAHVAHQLEKGKGHVHYYVKKLQKLGFIEILESWQVIDRGIAIPKTRGAATFYRVTQTGSNFLAAIERLVFERRLRLHNAYWKYPIRQPPRLPVDWMKVELRNWTQLLGRELGLTVRKNADRSIEMVTSGMDGRNPYRMLFEARDEADRLAGHLEQKFDMVLGRGSMSRKPHWGVFDPVANRFSEFFELSTKDAKIDQSEGYGEIDWLSPDAAESYLSMPHDLQRLKLEIEDVKSIMTTYAEGMRIFGEGMKEHMQLIRAIQAVVDRLDKLVLPPPAEPAKPRKRAPWEI